jgi:hypothetical protein
MPYKFIGLAGYGTRRTVVDDAAYLLYDAFDSAAPAGSVNGTQAEPIGGARTVADANGKITIANGALNFATGGVANDWVYWGSSAFTHAAGRAFIGEFGVRGANTSINFGYDTSPVAAAIRNSFTIGQTTMSYVTGAVAIALIPITNTAISLALVCRATAGFWYFAKGGGLTNWTLINFSIADGGVTIVPEVQTANTTAGFSVDNVRIPKFAYTIQPYTSDAFTATTTDGNGHPEGGATSGLAYTAVGTWGVSGGACSCSALSGGLGFRYLPTSSPDVIVSCVATRVGGVMGVVARYEDAQNYIIAYHDGTNFKVDKVVAGVTTNLSSNVRTYAAGANIRLTVRGTSAVGQYNFTSSVAVTVPASTSVNHGLYTTDIGNTFDNLQVWPTGSEGQYNGMNNL